MSSLTMVESEQMAKDNMKLVYIIANKHRERGKNCYDEMISAGMTGLAIGIGKFDPDREIKPTTYLSYWIDAYIRDCLYEDRHVHIPRNKLNARYRENKNQEEIKTHIPSEKSLDSDFGQHDSSLDRQTDSLENQIIDYNYNEDYLESSENVEHVNYMLDNIALSAIEKDVVIHRYGLFGTDAKTLEEISELTGYTPMGVKKAQDRAIVKLRKSYRFKEIV